MRSLTFFELRIPSGSGKSTLAGVLAGRETYEVTGGEVLFAGADLIEMEPEVRACEGLFMAFQYPVEIPGVSTINFLKALAAMGEDLPKQPVDDTVPLKANYCE